MTTKRKASVVELVEERYNERILQPDHKRMMENSPKSHIERFINGIHEIYEHAAWIDANIKGGCIVDPFFGFHFYEEEDAVAFKLRWE